MGPRLEVRYVPLYNAMRKRLNDQGLASGDDTEDELMRSDTYVFHKLGLDTFALYAQEAKRSKAPIDFDLDVDYIRGIWFCPTEVMVRSEKESPCFVRMS